MDKDVIIELISRLLPNYLFYVINNHSVLGELVTVVTERQIRLLVVMQNNKILS